MKIILFVELIKTYSRNYFLVVISNILRVSFYAAFCDIKETLVERQRKRKKCSCCNFKALDHFTLVKNLKLSFLAANEPNSKRETFKSLQHIYNI